MNRLKNAAHFESLKFVLSMYEITDEAMINALASVNIGVIREGDGDRRREARLSAWRKAI